MTAIFVNDMPHDPPDAPATWGDLLERLDAEASRDGLVLSAARFDGVEEPSFREPALAVRPLTEVARIEIETAAPDAFLRQCLRDSIQPLHEAARTAARLGAEFRRHDISAGHASLVGLAAELQALAALVRMLDGRFGIDVAAVDADGLTAAQHLQALDAILHSVIEAQEAEDWLTVGDILEYDLEPLIRRWAALLAALTANP